MMKRKVVMVLSLLFLFATICFAGHRLPEKYYQARWATEHGGMTEFRLADNSRVDILTDDYAIEVDFCSGLKVYEAVGQALYYAYKTKRQPGVLLILEDNSESTMAALKRARFLCERLRIKLWLTGTGAVAVGGK